MSSNQYQINMAGGFLLSNNKLPFFSCALFITLLVFVLLSHFLINQFHFHFAADSLPFQSSSSIQSTSCFSSLHHIRFHHHHNSISWNWDSISPHCHFHNFSKTNASDLLNGSRIVVAGDSQARFITLSLLSLLLNDSHDLDSVKTALFRRHSNYQIILSSLGIKLDFIWAPFVSNLTSFFSNTTNTSGNEFPHVLIMGSGLWDMLRVSNDSHYGASLELLRNSLQSSLSISGTTSMVPSPYMFWIGMPTLINSMLNTEEKREKMSNAASIAYERQVIQSKILRQSGGPLLLLDLKKLSRNCATSCTLDGMHYDQAVYEAAVHVMLNALLIESQQML